MPIYEYLCPSCGAHVERLVYSHDHKQVCFECGSKMEVIINPPALRFEGSGWQTKKPVWEGEK